jgi:hypothetical protein
MRIIKFQFLLFLLSFVLIINAQHDPHHFDCGVHFSTAEKPNASKKSFGQGFFSGFTTPHVVDTESGESFSWHYVTDFMNVDSIKLSDSAFANFLVNGTTTTELILYDDGLNNDQVSGDNIFSSLDMVYNSNPINYVGYQFLRFTNVTYYYSDNTQETSNIDLGYGIRFINGTNVSDPSIIPINSTTQATDHVLNLVIPDDGDEPFSDITSITSSYYNLFPDDTDFICVASTIPTPGGIGAANYQGIKHEETGLIHNGGPFDNSAFFGSRGNLNGIIRLNFTLGMANHIMNHELLHRFAAFLSPNLFMTTTPHWGVVEMESSGFASGFQVTDILDQGGNCYTTQRNNYSFKYSALEKYLMGLSSIDDIPWPITTLANFQTSNISSCQYSSDIGLVSINKQQFLQEMGPRVPDFTTAQKHFESRLIVVSKELLSPQELAYYNIDALQYELLVGDPDIVPIGVMNFHEATAEMATIGTKFDFSCLFNDSQSPTISCQDITIELDMDGTASIEFDQFGIANDNCSVPEITILKSDFDCDDTGTVSNSATATDASGNQKTCSFIVTVTDPAGHCSPDCHPDINAMLNFYTATGGPNWDNNTGWAEGLAGTNCNVCSWYAVTCNANGRVSALDFDGFANNSNGAPIGNNLIGGIPSALMDLEFLELLILSGNSLGGEIPASISQLTNLWSLSLNQCGLTGAIPEEISELPLLSRLALLNNNLSGQIPYSLGRMESLQFVFFQDNQFTGDIPASFGDLETLDFLSVRRNLLDGCLNTNLLKLCGQGTNIDIAQNYYTFDWDDFCAMYTGGCPCENILDVDNPITNDVYAAGSVLRSQGLVPADGDVIFQAGSEINLESNFNVEQGAIFEVFIESCGQ